MCGVSGQNLLPFRFPDYTVAPCPRMGDVLSSWAREGNQPARQIWRIARFRTEGRCARGAATSEALQMQNISHYTSSGNTCRVVAVSRS